MSELTYGQIMFKASHNSYEKDETISEQLTFNNDNPSNGGCLALEFDIWRHSDKDFVPFVSIGDGYFTVSHTAPGSTPLADWFAEILNWHDNNADHYPIMITLDIKSSHGGYDNFHEKIDTYLQCYFGDELIFKPNYFIGDSGLSICEQVEQIGWPKILSDELKGKFIFCLSGNKDWKSEYPRHDLWDRYCFSDSDKSDSNDEVAPPSDGDIIFFNFHIHDSNNGTWVNTIPAFGQKNLITRAYVVNSERNWDNCLRAKVSAIATDKINDYEWAYVDDDDPFLEKTYQDDKRYLKNKSNNKYRNDHATQMQDTYKSPDCTFIFESYGDNTYAIRNTKNNKYFDDSITTMSDTVDGDGQKWQIIENDSSKNEYYIKNCKNYKYMTNNASKLSDSQGDDEIYIIGEA
jgi:hypothetical protein